MIHELAQIYYKKIKGTTLYLLLFVLISRTKHTDNYQRKI